VRFRKREKRVGKNQSRTGCKNRPFFVI